MKVPSVALVAQLIGVTACADAPQPMSKTVVELGQLQIINGAPVLDAPSTAAVDSMITISVRTVGTACYSVERTDVAQNQDTGDLTPYDRRIIPIGPGSTCPANEMYLTHSGAFRFSSAGDKTITIHGATDLGSGDLSYGVTIHVQ